MVWLNSNNVRDLRTPFGGVKASGLGHEGDADQADPGDVDRPHEGLELRQEAGAPHGGSGDIREGEDDPDQPRERPDRPGPDGQPTDPVQTPPEAGPRADPLSLIHI